MSDEDIAAAEAANDPEGFTDGYSNEANQGGVGFDAGPSDAPSASGEGSGFSSFSDQAGDLNFSGRPDEPGGWGLGPQDYLGIALSAAGMPGFGLAAKGLAYGMKALGATPDPDRTDYAGYGDGSGNDYSGIDQDTLFETAADVLGQDDGTDLQRELGRKTTRFKGFRSPLQGALYEAAPRSYAPEQGPNGEVIPGYTEWAEGTQPPPGFDPRAPLSPLQRMMMQSRRGMN